MKIIYEDDAISGGGHGYLVFSDMKFPGRAFKFCHYACFGSSICHRNTWSLGRRKKSFYLLKKTGKGWFASRFTWGQE